MSHRNARLTFHGRRLLVARVESGMPVSHVAKAMGISRQCAHRWVARFAAEGEVGLHDRSSRPLTCPTQTARRLEQAVLEARDNERRGQDWIGPEPGVPARTVSRIMRRHQVPYLRECDPLTGEVIRSSKSTAVRYERDRPGELVHMDVKKVGRIPDGGGWKAHGRQAGSTGAAKRARIGFDFVHSLVDDHSRLACSEILPNEKGTTCAAFLLRAAAYFTTHGITSIERVMTDNHFSYRKSVAMAEAISVLDAKHKFIRPHCPWQNGKVCEEVQPHPASRAGLQARSSSATKPEPTPLPHGWSSTTLLDATPHSVDSRQPADCHQPDGRVHQGAGTGSAAGPVRRRCGDNGPTVPQKIPTCSRSAPQPLRGILITSRVNDARDFD